MAQYWGLPMFGPDSGSLAKQIVVWCDGRKPEAYQWFLEQIQVWGAPAASISAVGTSEYGVYSGLCATLLLCLWAASGGRNVQQTTSGALRRLPP